MASKYQGLLEKQLETSQAKQTTLSGRLAELDKYRTSVQPTQIGQIANMEDRPAGFNPLRNFETLSQVIASEAGTRSAASQDLERAEAGSMGLLGQLAQLEDEARREAEQARKDALKKDEPQYDLKDILNLRKSAKDLGEVVDVDENGNIVTRPMTTEEKMAGVEFTGGAKTKVGTLLGLATAVKGLQDTYDPKYSGVGQRSVQELGGFLGMKNEGFEAFRVSQSALTNAMLLYISGSQVTDTEAKRLMKQIPDWNDSDARVAAKLKQLQQTITGGVQGFLDVEGLGISAKDYLQAKTGFDNVIETEQPQNEKTDEDENYVDNLIGGN